MVAHIARETVRIVLETAVEGDTVGSRTVLAALAGDNWNKAVVDKEAASGLATLQGGSRVLFEEFVHIPNKVGPVGPGENHLAVNEYYSLGST